MLTGKTLSVALVALLLIGGCRGEQGDAAAPAEAEQPVLTAATLGEQRVLANAEYLEVAPWAAADKAAGARQSQLCRACHSLEEGGPNMIGPNLYGFFGRRSGTHEGFDYSEAVRATNFVWTPRALDAWLAQPARFLPGNRMIFAGVNDEGNRADLIAYLLEATDGGRQGAQ